MARNIVWVVVGLIAGYIIGSYETYSLQGAIGYCLGGGILGGLIGFSIQKLSRKKIGN